jgi:integrase
MFLCVHYTEHYPLFLTLAGTGMRIGEALGLQWGDINFNGRFIEVKRRYSKGRIFTPKNNKTRRVGMSSQLCETLKAHQVECKQKGLTLGLGSMPEYVFTNEMGNLIDLDKWRRRVFNKALEKAELRKVRVHACRYLRNIR